MAKLELGASSVDLETGVVSGDEEVRLSPRELALLKHLVERPGQVVGRDELSTGVFGYHPNARTRAVDKAMHGLRAKVERDPSAPEHLHTLPGVGYRFAPAAPAAPRTTPLPPVGPELVGREEDEARVVDALRRGAVAVVGPGGVGKTRLALAVAGRLRAEVAGTFWCELTTVSGPAHLVHELASTLGVRPAEVGAVGAWLARQGRVLVVLDEADALTAPVGELLQALRTAAPEARFLVTSREVVAGAACHRLEPLDPVAAVRLLERRVSDLGGAPTSADRAALPALVERLDRLPLALELAAHPLATAMSPAELVGHLERFHEVPATPPDGRTLASTVAVSWTLLDEGQRRALAALCAVPGSIGAEGAAALFEVDAAEALALLAVFRRRSLVATLRAPAEPDKARFRPYESVRDFCVSRAPADERAATWARYRRWLLAEADAALVSMDLGSPGQRRVAAERAALTAIAGEAASEPDAAMTALRLLEGVWLNQDPVGYRRAIERALDAGGDRMARESLLFGEGMRCFTLVRTRQGDVSEHLDRLEEVVRRLDPARDAGPFAIRLLSRYSIAAFEAGDARRAAQGALRALTEWDATLRDGPRATLHVAAGNALRVSGDARSGAEHYRLALRYGADAPLTIAVAWANLALLSPPLEAVALFRRGLAALPEENRQAESPMRGDFAHALMATGALAEAREVALSARRDARAVGRPVGWYRANLALCALDREEGRPSEALAWLDELDAEPAFDGWRMQTDDHRATALVDLGRAAEAVTVLERALAPPLLAAADTHVIGRGHLAVALARCGRFDAARAQIARALADPRPPPLDSVRAWVLPRYALAVEALDPEVEMDPARVAELPEPSFEVLPHLGLELVMADRWLREALASR